MRVQRFEQYMKDLIVKDDSDEVTNVRTFSEAGLSDKPNGLRVDFASGATVYVQFVRTSPGTGEDFKQPETIVRKQG